MPLVGGVAGGFIGNQITGLVEDQLNKSGNANAGTIAPLGTILIGSLITMFAPEQFRSIGVGMVAVAGTESVEGLVSGAMTPTPTVTNSATERVYPNQSVQGLSGMQELEMLY